MKQNGSNLRVYRNGTLIAYERDFTFTIDNNLPDASNKDSGGFAEHIRGQKSATLDFTALVDLTADYGMPEALNELIDRGEITVSWQLVDSATEFYAGRASYSTISSDASNEDVVLWSGSLTINGDFGIYPVSLTRALRTTNDNTGFQVSNVFGFDSGNNFYYMANANGDIYRLKNSVESVINTDFDTSDLIGFNSNNGLGFFGIGGSDELYSVKSGIETAYTIPDFISCDDYCIDGDFIYYTYNDTNLFLSKYNWRTNTVVWSTDTGDVAVSTNVFQVIKQGTHIVISQEVGLSEVWTLEVFNESTGAFIRTVAVVTDADTVGVWMAVLGTTIYLGYGDGTLSYYKKLTFNNTTVTNISSGSTSNTVCPVRVFNNKIYVKIGTGLYIYNSSDVEIGTSEVDLANIVDFVINNGVLIAYKSSDTTIKCFPV